MGGSQHSTVNDGFIAVEIGSQEFQVVAMEREKKQWIEGNVRLEAALAILDCLEHKLKGDAL